jgi:hypothetical protein
MMKNRRIEMVEEVYIIHCFIFFSGTLITGSDVTFESCWNSRMLDQVISS